MLRAAIVASLLVATGAGCQTFIGVEDAEAHLPRLDGTYLMAIHRTRSVGTPPVQDIIRTRCTARLDLETRMLDLDFEILGFNSDTSVAEGSISDLEFPVDATSATFEFNLSILPSEVDAPAPTGADLAIHVPAMILRAEAEYSFCAEPATTVLGMPTLGTVLIQTGKALPTGASVDSNCDEEP